MSKKIVIDPVTRIEGHAKITITLNDNGDAEDAKIHVTQFRGFEKFCEGRPFEEMPSLMARTCGICPVSHLVSGSKAGDGLLAVEVPVTAQELRRMMNLAQIIQSHALSFFYLSSADLIYGFDADKTSRNIFGMMQSHPDLARSGIRLRSFGQQIIEKLGGKRIHPGWMVPGGVNRPLDSITRDEILAMIPEAKQTVLSTIEFFKSCIDKYEAEVANLANIPTLFMGLVNKDGNLEHYDGKIRVMDSHGTIIADGLEPSHYSDYIGEKVEEWSFLKSPYYKPLGYEQGAYRVGPLARLNIIDKCGTHLADKELNTFRDYGRPQLASFFYHYARLIEILYGIEKIEEILNGADILSKHVRAHAGVNKLEAVGMSEAPRGMLLHHYKVDEHGLVKWANLIIATGHNNLAMNAGITQAAKKFVKGGDIKEGALNRVEAVIRCFDPCLSCSTHAAGQMPLVVNLQDPNGKLIKTIAR